MRPPALLTICAVLSGAGCATPGAPTLVPAVANAASPVAGIVTAGRLDASDIRLLRQASIRHVIDLTPDAETPDFDEAGVFRQTGIGYSNLPLRGASDLTLANVKLFDALIKTSPRPLLVHCASGNRVGAMAALRAAWVQGQSLDAAIATGKAWGLSGLEGEVRQRLQGLEPESSGSTRTSAPH
jgi:uncharacterized protein (TIGR01244 family)